MSKLLILTLVFTLLTPVFALAETSTTKEDLGDYASAVNRLNSLGVLTGDEKGNFNVDDTITRAEFAAMSVRLLGLDEAAKISGGQTSFKDSVAPWAQGYVNVAVQQGLLTGYTDGTFREKNPVTQAEALAILIRALGYDSQVAKTGWPTNYVVKGVELGLTDGVDNVSANAPAKRGDIFKFADNALTVNKLVQTQFGDTPRYEVSDKTLLTDNLGAVKVKGLVTDIPRTDSTLDDNEIRVDGNLYTVSSNVDLEEVYNAKVTVFVNSDDEILDLTVTSTQKYDAVSYSAADEELTLIGEDKTYDVDFGNEDFDYDYAKIRFDAEGYPDSVVGYDWEDNMVVEKVDNNVVFSYGEELNLKGYTIVKGGKTITIADLKAGDILFYNNTDKYAEVYNDSVSGNITEVYTTSFKVDTKTYTLDGEYLNASDTSVALTSDALLQMKDEGAVTVFFNRAGDVVFVSGDLGVAPTSTVYGLVIADTKFWDTRSGTLYSLDVVTTNGEKVNYDVPQSVVTAYNSVAGQTWTTDIILDVNNNKKIDQDEEVLVKITLDEDGNVTAVSKLDTTTTSADTLKTDANYLGNNRVTGSTPVFITENFDASVAYSASNKVEVISLSDADFDTLTTANANVNNTTHYVKFLIAFATDRDTDTTDFSAVITNVKTLTGTPTQYLLTMKVDGETKQYYTKKGAASSFADIPAANKIAVVTLDKNTDLVVGYDAYTNVNASKVITGVSVADGTITTASGTYELLSDAKIYDFVTGVNTNINTTGLSIRDLKVGDSVEIYTDLNNSSIFAKYVLRTGKYTTTAPVTPDLVTITNSYVTKGTDSVVTIDVPAGNTTVYTVKVYTSDATLVTQKSTIVDATFTAADLNDTQTVIPESISEAITNTKEATFLVKVYDEVGVIATKTVSVDALTPSVASAASDATNQVVITMDQALAGTVAANGAFTVNIGAGTGTVSSVTVNGTKVTITLDAATPIANGDVVTVDYTATGTNDLVDAAGNKVVDFTAKPVTNNN